MRGVLLAILLAPVAGAAHSVDVGPDGVKADVGAGEFIAYVLLDGVGGIAREVPAGATARLDLMVASADHVDMSFDVTWEGTNIDENTSGSFSFLVGPNEGRGESIEFVPRWPDGPKTGRFDFTVVGRELGGDANRTVVEVPLTFSIVPAESQTSRVPTAGTVGAVAAAAVAASVLGRKR